MAAGHYHGGAADNEQRHRTWRGRGFPVMAGDNDDDDSVDCTVNDLTIVWEGDYDPR